MQKSKPFARAIAVMGLISEAMDIAMPMLRQLAMTAIPEYKSRGKGLGKHSGKKWGSWPSGKYTQVFNGKRECERRMRQTELRRQKELGEYA